MRIDLKENEIEKKNLLLENKKYFPYSRIIGIQQQIPGCDFVPKNIVLDRHPNLDINYCRDLGKVYQIQDHVLKTNPTLNVEIHPICLNKVINDSDIYDYLHTNKEGAKNIATYIKSIF